MAQHDRCVYITYHPTVSGYSGGADYWIVNMLQPVRLDLYWTATHWGCLEVIMYKRYNGGGGGESFPELQQTKGISLCIMYKIYSSRILLEWWSRISSSPCTASGHPLMNSIKDNSLMSPYSLQTGLVERFFDSLKIYTVMWWTNLYSYFTMLPHG